ncbi:MAG TPA: 6-carboxytetrahydropterin synthase [Longimicrobiales bacterium]|nr:6-carboxytetrahydropterin synthase [Longimicrobiales bacterium]
MSDRCVYTVSVQAHYDSAHFLVNYKGKCERLHGHRYVVDVAVQTPDLDASGIDFDFVDLKSELRALANHLDHGLLTDLPEFEGVEKSAENQARWFYQELKKRLPEPIRSGLLYARVWETPTQWAQYGPAGAPLPAPISAEG